MTLASGDLTTLLTAQQYLDSPPSAAVLSGMITRTSRAICGYLNRPVLTPYDYNEQFNGSGTRQLVLPNYPLLVLKSLNISGSEVKLAPQPSENNVAAHPYGYRFQPWNGAPPGVAAVIELTGGGFYLWSQQGVTVKYRAGYQVTDETQTVPTDTPFQVLPIGPFGIWATDEGVKYVSNSVQLSPIGPTGTPTVGQYIPPDPNALPTPRPFYTFAAEDAGQVVSLSYGYIPADLEQAALETIQDRVSYRKRAGGVRSQSLASQESITYASSDGYSDYVKSLLNPYCSPLPPAMGAFV